MRQLLASACWRREGDRGRMEAAKKLENRPMAFAVADVGAEMIATARMDGASPRILRHSIRKAYTAALMCRHTLSFKCDLEERSGALDQWGDLDLTTLPGGLAVQRGDIFVGGIGAGGGGPHERTSAPSWCAHGLEVSKTSARSEEDFTREKFDAKNVYSARKKGSRHWAERSPPPDRQHGGTRASRIDFSTGTLGQDAERQIRARLSNLSRCCVGVPRPTRSVS